MKVIFDHQIFGRQVYGGISRYIVEIATRIPSIDGTEVAIFAPFHVNRYLGLHKNLSAPRTRLPLHPQVVRRSNQANRLLGKISIQPRSNVAVFHETYYSTDTYAPRNSKRILTVHDMIHERFPMMFPANDRTRESKRAAVLRADHIICVSENTRNDLVELLDVPMEKTSVIHLGNSLTTNAGSGGAQSITGKPFLLYVGERSGYKNFSTLLVAYGRSKVLQSELRLVCFGGSAVLSNDERQLVHNLGIAEAEVMLLGGDDQTLSYLYSAATALVYPSLYEGFGIPPLEALAHGCPVICASAGSLPEVVGDAGLLFDPTDTDQLRHILENLLHFSRERRAELVTRGLRRAQRFSWDACARNTLTLYEAVAA